MRRFGLLLVAVLVLASFPAAAQQQSGDSELQLQGSLALGLKGDTPDNGTVYVNYGRFLTNRQELGGSVSVFLVGDSEIEGYGGPFYRYNFSTGKTVPYVGASVAGSIGDYSAGNFLLTVEGGVRWFLERNMAFTLAANENYDFDRSEFADRLQILFGFSYIWGR